jgi:hypothetical protein
MLVSATTERSSIAVSNTGSKLMMSSRTANRRTRIRRASRSATVMVAPLSGRHYARTTCPVDAAPFKRDEESRDSPSLGIQQQGPRDTTDRGSSAFLGSIRGGRRSGASAASFIRDGPLRSLNVGPQQSAIGILVDFLEKCVLFMHFDN